MRRLFIASALGVTLLAAAGFGGTASARPMHTQAPVAAAASDASLLTQVHYRRGYGHQYRRSYHAHRQHYAPPPRHHWRHHHHHRGWR